MLGAPLTVLAREEQPIGTAGKYDAIDVGQAFDYTWEASSFPSLRKSPVSITPALHRAQGVPLVWMETAIINMKCQ